jgi:hypothetical protein
MTTSLLITAVSGAFAAGFVGFAMFQLAKLAGPTVVATAQIASTTDRRPRRAPAHTERGGIQIAGAASR